MSEQEQLSELENLMLFVFERENRPIASRQLKEGLLGVHMDDLKLLLGDDLDESSTGGLLNPATWEFWEAVESLEGKGLIEGPITRGPGSYKAFIGVTITAAGRRALLLSTERATDMPDRGQGVHVHQYLTEEGITFTPLTRETEQWLIESMPEEYRSDSGVARLITTNSEVAEQLIERFESAGFILNHS